MFGTVATKLLAKTVCGPLFHGRQAANYAPPATHRICMVGLAYEVMPTKYSVALHNQHHHITSQDVAIPCAEAHDLACLGTH